LTIFLSKSFSTCYFIASLSIQRNPNISEECIEKFAEVISRLDNLSSFDLYFRRYFDFYTLLNIAFRLSLSPRGILELGKRIQASSNTKCSCSKESIHIYKRKQIE